MQTMPGSEENCRVHVRVSLDISGESRAGRERVEVGRKGKAQKLKVVERLGEGWEVDAGARSSHELESRVRS